MRVVVAGGTGFIGRAVVDRLLAPAAMDARGSGHSVAVTTRDPAESARFANAAAAMSVSRSGARGGMTTEPDVRAFLARHTA